MLEKGIDGEIRRALFINVRPRSFHAKFVRLLFAMNRYFVLFFVSVATYIATYGLPLSDVEMFSSIGLGESNYF